MLEEPREALRWPPFIAIPGQPDQLELTPLFVLADYGKALGRTSTFVVIPGQPGQLDLTTLFEGKPEPVQTFAIYQILNDNWLTYCIAEPSRPRPTDFTTAPGDGRTLVTLRRITAD
jgi:hypothetical protein